MNYHSDVDKILQIIKETDDEFRETECQLLDDIERKRKEDDIKNMEKELKKQKLLQAKLKKENEKAQRKREKVENNLQIKKSKPVWRKQQQTKNSKILRSHLKEPVRMLKFIALQ